jgi:hypothetical protein
MLLSLALLYKSYGDVDSEKTLLSLLLSYRVISRAWCLMLLWLVRLHEHQQRARRVYWLETPYNLGHKSLRTRKNKYCRNISSHAGI